jgi:hypothetical protein
MGDPQSLNLYSYVGNNPLSRNDPDGHWVCGGTKDECNAEKELIDENRNSTNKSIRASAEAYGPLSKKPGDKGDNGVTVKFGATGPDGGNTTFNHDKTGVVVTMDSNLVVNGAKAGDTTKENAGAAAMVAHEGSHVEDFKADIANHFDAAHDITIRQSEYNAYEVQNAVYNEHGFSLQGTGVDLSSPAGIDRVLHEDYGDRNLDVPISTVVAPQ